jgi:hypothetical protein
LKKDGMVFSPSVEKMFVGNSILFDVGGRVTLISETEMV